jgi:hypothetical protein
MRYSRSKEIDRIVRSHLQRAWTYRRGRKHGLLSPPNCGLFVVVPGTPSDHRSLQNFERDLKRLSGLASGPYGPPAVG